MPNWCECDLTVVGPKHKVEHFLEHAKGENGPFDFNQFLAYPERFAELDRAAEEWLKQPPESRGERPKDGYNQGGYDWCRENWGTKWNACRPAINPETTICWEEDGEEKFSVEINFETAWSPPRPVVERASELFPGLHFDLRYFESGLGFNGMFVCESGEVVSDDSGDYYGNRGG